MKPQNNKTSQRRLIAAQNREKVVELRLAGYKLSTIAKQVGISTARCCKIIKDEIKLYNEKTAEDIGLYRAIQNDRLERILRTHWRAANSGSMPATDRVLRVLKQQGDLLGLDAPAKVAQTNIDGTENAYDGMTEEEVDARIDELIKKMYGDSGKTENS